MLCLWIPRSHLFLLAATLIPSRGALVMPCCMPLQFLYAGQEHEEMCRTAGPSHGGSTGKGVFHISVGSKPLRLNVWKMVPCTWANQISWIIVQHSLCLATVCIIFNFLQVIIWWISHAHQAVICPPSLREPQRLCISRGKKKSKMCESKHMKQVYFIWTYFLFLVIPGGFLWGIGASCMQKSQTRDKKGRCLRCEVTFQWNFHPLVSYVWLCQKKGPLCVHLYFKGHVMA